MKTFVRWLQEGQNWVDPFAPKKVEPVKPPTKNFPKGSHVKIMKNALYQYTEFWHKLNDQVVGIVSSDVQMPGPRVLPQYNFPSVRVKFPELNNIEPDIFVHDLIATNETPKESEKPQTFSWERMFNNKSKIFSKEARVIMAQSTNFEDFISKLVANYGSGNTWRVTGPHGYYGTMVLIDSNGKEIASETDYNDLKELKNLASK
jgi:hypothetical protein